MTNEELSQIEERNLRRKQRKSQTSPGEWLYESFAFVEAGTADPMLPHDKQMSILVRRRTWFDRLWERFGHDVLDKGRDTNDIQPYYDADFIVYAHNDNTEADVEALIAEVKRLRGA